MVPSHSNYQKSYGGRPSRRAVRAAAGGHPNHIKLARAPGGRLVWRRSHNSTFPACELELPVTPTASTVTSDTSPASASPVFTTVTTTLLLPGEETWRGLRAGGTANRSVQKPCPSPKRQCRDINV